MVEGRYLHDNKMAGNMTVTQVYVKKYCIKIEMRNVYFETVSNPHIII